MATTLNTNQNNNYSNRSGFCKGLPNQPTCMNRATLDTGLCHSCNDKPKEGETWFIKLPNSDLVFELKIIKFFKKCVNLENDLLYKIDDVEFVERVRNEN